MSLRELCRQARARGEKRVHTGKPCKRGHICDRFSDNGGCVECCAVQAKESHKRRRLAGLDMRGYHRQWYAKNAEKCCQSSRNWRAANPDKTKAQLAKWERENRQKRLEIRRRRAALKRGDINAWHTAWRKANRPKMRAKNAIRKARKLMATPSWVDKKALVLVYQECPIGMHVDHIVPLKGKTVCGLHVPWNLQYLTPEQNLAKGNRL